MEKGKHRKKGTKRPWPTKDAMAQVYEKNLWGGKTAFYSGEGSHRPELVDPYIEVVRKFLSAFDPPLSVCDLGCGDFNVGRQLVDLTRSYVAVDIVPDLIARNQGQFRADQLEFRCMDIAEDDLPPADCALLRQVLQHLSNAEVEKVVEKLGAYRYVILTEHLPKGEFIPNKDIISGQGIRLKKQSGVDLMAPPFNFRAKQEKRLLSVDAGDGNGRIVTRFYEVG